MNPSYITAQQFTVTLPNLAGQLEKVTALLNNNKFNILGLSSQIEGNVGLVRFTVEGDPTPVTELLKASGFSPISTPVTVVTLGNTPGSLTGLLGFLTKNSINVNGIYGTVPVGIENAAIAISIDSPAPAFPNAEEVFKAYFSQVAVGA